MISAPLPENEASRLECLQQCALLDTEAEPEYDDLTRLASFLCGTPIALISLVEADRQWFKSRVGLEQTETPRDVAFCAHTLHHLEEPLVIPDAALDSRFADNPMVVSGPRIRFYAGVALVTPEGCAIGTLCVKDTVPRNLSVAQLEALRALGRQVMTLVELRRSLAEQQRVQEENRQNHARLRLLESAMQHTSDMVIITKFEPGVQRRLRIVYVNEAFVRLTGYTREEIIDQTPYILHGPKTDSKTLDAMAQKFRNGEVVSTEILLYRKDGTEFWSDLNVQTMVDDSRQNSYCIAIVRDITERRLAHDLLEARVQERTASLKASEEQLSLTLRSARMGHYDFNLVTSRANWSEGVYTMLGLAPATGEVDAAVFGERLHPDDGEPLMQEINLAIAEKREYIHEYRIVRPDGEVRWIAVHGKCQYDALGTAQRLTGVMMDITGRKQAEEERKRLEAQVLQNEKLASLGELVAGVAHEINNPLATISVNAQLLLMHPDEKIQKRGETIKRMADRASRIVRSLLMFTHGGGDERRSEALNTIVENTLEMCAYKLSKADVELELTLDAHLPAVWVNANQIQQILLNLFNNAEYALRQRTDVDRRLILVTRVVQDSEGVDRASLSITDNACGIPPEVLRRIFDPFFTTKDIGVGTGLGLSICHGIAAAHGGALTAQSQVGVGTTFTLTLPVYQTGVSVS